MLLNDFFKISSKELINENELNFTVQIDPEHEIFKGHFPGQPVVPGVVSVQIINELLNEHLGVSLMMSSARSIKYISMIDPTVNPVLNYEIKFSETEDGTYKVNAQVSFEDIIFVKFTGQFSILSAN